MKIVALETTSIVEAYKGLNEMTSLGHTALEFSPHAEGARVLFRRSEGAPLPNNTHFKELNLTETVVKAYLGLGGTKLLKKMMVIEDKSLWSIFQTVQNLEELGATVLEVRSFKSNPKLNHAIVTFNPDDKIANAVTQLKHVIMDSDSPALKDFLGFTNT